MATLFEHHGVQLWTPEGGGPVDFDGEEHEQLMDDRDEMGLCLEPPQFVTGLARVPSSRLWQLHDQVG